MEINSAVTDHRILAQLNEQREKLEAEIEKTKAILTPLYKIWQEKQSQEESGGIEENQTEEECQDGQEDEGSKYAEMSSEDFRDKVIRKYSDIFRDLQKNYQKKLGEIQAIKDRPAVKKYEENLAELQSLGADGTNISKEKINSFIDRLKFDSARNPDRNNDLEPTCPVCQQWVDQNRTIKSIMHV